MEEFNKNLNWIYAWSNKHLKHILNILIPYVAVLLLIISYIHLKFKNVIVEQDKDLKVGFLLCLIASALGTFSFFFLFPLYRYGYSYIITFISLLCILIIKNKISIKENIIIFRFIFIFCFIIIIAKQGIKIFNNYKNEPWPNIYTLDPNGKISQKTKIEINNNFFYYLANKDGELCMYSKSPCTVYRLKNIKYSLKNTYIFLTLN
jgi:hypothetical protein